METDTELNTVRIHHQILPHLIEADLVAVDWDKDRVQYVGGSFETALIDWLRDQNQ